MRLFILFYCNFCFTIFSTSGQTEYTIGGTSPDFVNFSTAITFLEETTLTETLIFSVREGVYEENFSIPVINGANETNQIIFRGLTDNVIIQNPPVRHGYSSYYRKFLVALRGASWVTFDNLNFVAILEDATYINAVLGLYDLANNNTITNCSFSAINLTANNLSFIGVDNSIPNYTGDEYFNVVRNCTFTDGEYGIRYQNYHGGIQVSDCIFNNQMIAALFFKNTGGIEKQIDIHNNQISNNTGHAILTERTYQSIILKNNVVNNLKNGIQLEYSGSANSSSTKLINNLIIAEKPITVSASKRIELLHNTVTSAAEGENRPTQIINCDTAHLVNNIFTNYGTATTVELNQIDSVYADYNNIYVNNTNNTIVRINNTNLPLRTLQRGDTTYQHTTSYDPKFSNEYLPQASALNNAGKALSAVTTDINGMVRGILPDLGAFEFEPQSYDVELTEMTAPIAPFPAGDNVIQIKLTNYGNESLTTLDIDWSLTTVSNTYNWTGNLATGESEIVEITNFEFPEGQVDTLVAIAKKPNGQTDSDPQNDTLRVNNIIAALQGEYGVGPNADVFQELPQAAYVLSVGGALGAVTFNLKPGVHTGVSKFGFFPGMGENTPIIVQSATRNQEDVVLQVENEALLGPITLGAVDNFTLRDVQIESNGESSFSKSLIFLLCGGDSNNNIGCNNLIFENIRGRFFGTTDNGTGINFFGGLQGSNVRISNFNLENGGMGIQVLDTAIDDFIVENSEIDVRYHNIRMTKGSDIQINNCQFNLNPETDFVQFGGERGIFLNDCSGNIEFNNNKLRVSRNSALHISGRNSVALESVNLTNNLIYSSESIVDQFTNDLVIIRNAANLNFLYNTLFHYNPDQNSVALHLQDKNGAHRVLNNNIYAQYGAAINIEYNNSDYFAGDLEIDYNNYYTDTLPLFRSSRVGYTVPDLADWQRVSGLDANSLNVPAYFGTDIFAFNSELNGAAKVLTDVVNDIDGTPRSSITPDIGAFEFTPPPNDAGIIAISPPTIPFSDGQHPISLTLKNFGSAALSEVEIYYSINGDLPMTTTWTGNLAAAESTEVIIENLTFENLIEHQIKAWTRLPNGIDDAIFSNDTTTIDKVYTGLAGTYSVGTMQADFSDLEILEEAMTQGGIVGDVEFNIADGEYQTNFVMIDVAKSEPELTIIMQSASQDSSLVTIRSANETRILLKVTTTDYVTFRQLGFEIEEGEAAVFINGAVSNLLVENCFFRGTGTNNGTAVSVGDENGESMTASTIRGNRIENTYRGISVFAASEFTANLFVENDFNNVKTAMELHDESKSWVAGNTFRDNEISIHLLQTAECRVTHNQFYGGSDSWYGILSTVNEAEMFIYNNYFEFTPQTRFEAAVEISRGENVYFDHNTVRIKSTIRHYSNAFAIKLRSPTTSIFVRNNLISNLRNHIYEIENAEPSDLIMDHNVYWGADNYFADFYRNTSTNYTSLNLAEWQQKTNLDLNSGFFDPRYGDMLGYKVQNVSLKNFSSTNGSVFGRQFDIEGNIRNTPPTVGAYEITNALSIANVLFQAQATDQQTVRLFWKLNISEPIQDFVVQRSMDGVTFFDLEKILDHGKKIYQSFDLQPRSGVNYYRLITNYVNEKQQTSILRTVDVASFKQNWYITPNPTQGITRITRFVETKNDGYLYIFDSVGKLISQQVLEKSKSDWEINLSDLPVGIYQLIILDEEKRIAKTLIRN